MEKRMSSIRLEGYSPQPEMLALGTAESYGTERVQLIRGAGWEGLTVTATFSGYGGPALTVAADGDDSFSVPAEVTRKAVGNSGAIIVLAGYADGVRRISTNVGFVVKHHGPYLGGNPGEVTPTLVEQLLAAERERAQNERLREAKEAQRIQAEEGRQEELNAKQDKLVSGESLKTVNGESLLGSGDITIQGGTAAPPYDDTELRGSIATKQDRLVSGQSLKTVNGESLLGGGNITVGGASQSQITEAVNGYLSQNPVSANVTTLSAAAYRYSGLPDGELKLHNVKSGLFTEPTRIYLGKNYFPEASYWLRNFPYKGIVLDSADKNVIGISGTSTEKSVAIAMVTAEGATNTKFTYDDLVGGEAMELLVFNAKEQPAGTQIQIRVTVYSSTEASTEYKLNLGYQKATAPGIQSLNFTLPENFTGMGFQILAVTTAKTYDNELICVVRKQADDIIEAVSMDSSAAADWDEITLSSGEKEFCTYPNPIRLEYQVNPKEYTDEKFQAVNDRIDSLNVAENIDLGYLTPEMYGAKGDGSTDDTAAINACVAAATGKPVRGFNRYRVNGALVFTGNNKDIYLHYVDSVATSGDAICLNALKSAVFTVGALYSKTAGSALSLTGGTRRCRIQIDYLSNTAGYGITFGTEGDGNTMNNITALSVQAALDAVATVPAGGSNFYNEFHLAELQSTQGSCIAHMNECYFFGGKVKAPLGYVVDSCLNCKFYDFSMEHELLGGIRNASSCMFTGFRTIELADYGTETETGKKGYSSIFKLSGAVRPNRFISSNHLPLTNIDASEMYDREQLLAYFSTALEDNPSQSYASRPTVIDADVYNCSYYAFWEYLNGNGLLDAPPVNAGYNVSLGKRCLVFLGRKIVIPESRQTVTVTEDIDLRNPVNIWLPSRIIMGADAAVTLSDSYCSMGIDTLTVDQTGHTAVIYDRNGSVIFNGSGYAPGVYEISFLANLEPLRSSDVQKCYENLLNDSVTVKKID